MKTFTRTNILTAAVFSLAAGLSMSAAARDYSETVVSPGVGGLATATVSYDDLDLTSSAGQSKLHYRLSRAARAVCGSNDMRLAGSVRQASENQNCYENSLAEAMSETNRGNIASVSH